MNINNTVLSGYNGKIEGTFYGIKLIIKNFKEIVYSYNCSNKIPDDKQIKQLIKELNKELNKHDPEKTKDISYTVEVVDSFGKHIDNLVRLGRFREKIK